MDKVTYKCNCCGWEKSIAAAWADVSPRWCGDGSCEFSLKKSKGKKSYKSHPDMLQKIMPVAKPKEESRPVKTSQSKVRKKRK